MVDESGMVDELGVSGMGSSSEEVMELGFLVALPDPLS